MSSKESTYRVRNAALLKPINIQNAQNMASTRMIKKMVFLENLKIKKMATIIIMSQF